MKGLVAALLLFASILPGCSALSKRDEMMAPSTTFYERRCGPTIPVEPLDREQPSVSEPRLGILQREFSSPAFESATALGVLPYLDRYLNLEQQVVGPGTEGPALAYLRERRHITDRITLGILDVSSAAAETGCEGGRAALLAEHLHNTLDKRQGIYTVFGLVGSGVLTIISGGIAIGANSIGVINTANIATVIGGASELIFGSAALIDTTARGELLHERNVLRDVWTGDNNTLAPSVWSFLNTRLTDQPTEVTLRENLIMRWQHEGWLGPEGSETERHRIDLFFGTGGRYTIDELEARASMLDLLETDIRLMHKGLNALIRELLKRDKV
ncbi:MAG TPA: hypothetical protein VJR03_07525 [Nitrospira sp.]|nr:hypothetical protein [Nitrospira sp.]